MATDPLCRAPRTWEMTNPFPPPKKETYFTDPRIEDAKRAWAWLPEDFKVCLDYWIVTCADSALC